MQPILPNPAAVDPAPEPRAGSVVAPPAAAPHAERRHFVFGLFGETAKAEDALRKLRAARFEDRHVLIVGGAAVRNGDGIAVLWDRLPAGTPFVSLVSLLRTPDAGTPAPQGALAPRITQQITDYLDRSGAVLIVVIQTAEQERMAARTLLTCRCDVLLTHEVAVRP